MIVVNRLCFARSRLACCLHQTALRYSSGPVGKKQGQTQKQILVQLRKETGYPLAKCKQALIKSNYDVKTALAELHENAEKENWEKMENLKFRKATQGLVTTYRVDGRAVLLEINCETDFVAKNSAFQSFVGLTAKSVLKHYSSNNDTQMTLNQEDILTVPTGPKDLTVEETLATVIGKVKENVTISRGIIANVDQKSNEFIGIYTHPDLATPVSGGRLPLMGRYAAVVGMRTTALEPQGRSWLHNKARDLAQHVVGMNPSTIGTRGEIKTAESPNLSHSENPKSEISEENEEDEGSLTWPAVSLDSDELVKQAFLLDANITVQNWLDIHRLEVLYFIRYELGEKHLEQE